MRKQAEGKKPARRKPAAHSARRPEHAGRSGQKPSPASGTDRRRGAPAAAREQRQPAAGFAVQRPRSERCPYSRKCGGCQLQNLEYPDQLRWKQRLMERLIGRFCSVAPILGMDAPYHYRCKVQAAFGVVRGKFVCGIYQSSTHHIIPVEHCRLED